MKGDFSRFLIRSLMTTIIAVTSASLVAFGAYFKLSSYSHWGDASMILGAFIIGTITHRGLKNFPKPKYETMEIGSSNFLRNVYGLHYSLRTKEVSIVSPVQRGDESANYIANKVGKDEDVFMADLICNYKGILYQYKKYGTIHQNQVIFMNQEDAQKALDSLTPYLVINKLAN